MTDDEALAEANRRWTGRGFVMKIWGSPPAIFLGGVSYEVGMRDDRDVLLGLGRGAAWEGAFSCVDRHAALRLTASIQTGEVAV